MELESSKFWEKMGIKVGFIFTYFVFTTILYFILKLLNKLPGGWLYWHIMQITLFIILIGTLIRLCLK